MRFILLAIAIVLLASCKQRKTAGDAANKKGNEKQRSIAEHKDKVVDSLLNFKPMKLSIKEDRSDVDELIPVGYNEQGGIAYFINRNSGAAISVDFDIISHYEGFRLHTEFDLDQELDSLLPANKDLLYQALSRGKIKLVNSFTRMSPDSFKNKYGYTFNYQKTLGPPDPDYGDGRKTLSTISVTYQKKDEPATWLDDKKFGKYHGVYDMYISDCLVVPSDIGVFGFVVFVTESIGFEGYIRKYIEVMSLGVIEEK